MFRPLLLLVVCLLGACGDSSSRKTSSTSSAAPAPPPAPPATGASTGVTIQMGPDGRTQVQGAPPPSGDPRACADLKACCASPDLGLFCGLAQATGDPCEAQLRSVQAHMKETNAKKPPGCP
jgi:hypothetical protein